MSPVSGSVLSFAAAPLRMMRADRLLQLDEDSVVSASPLYTAWLHWSRTGFMDITAHPHLGTQNAERSLGEPRAPYPNSTRCDGALRRAFAHVDKKGPRADLDVFTAFYTRYYRSETGRASQRWLLGRAEALAGALRGNASVHEFAHAWGQNTIILHIPGKDALLSRARGVTILGAHQDSSNLLPFLRAPGADDDGSGTVTLLEALRALAAAQWEPQTDVEFHWYSAEEGGLLGSQAVAAAYEERGIRVRGMLQQDMTAYVKEGTEEVVGLVTDYVDTGLTDFVELLVRRYLTIPPARTQTNYGASDHASWHRARYPSSFAIEARFQDCNLRRIHTTQDTVDHAAFSFPHLLQFVRLSMAFAVELGTPPVDPLWDARVADSVPGTPTTRGGHGGDTVSLAPEPPTTPNRARPHRLQPVLCDVDAGAPTGTTADADAGRAVLVDDPLLCSAQMPYDAGMIEQWRRLQESVAHRQGPRASTESRRSPTPPPRAREAYVHDTVGLKVATDRLAKEGVILPASSTGTEKNAAEDADAEHWNTPWQVDLGFLDEATATPHAQTNGVDDSEHHVARCRYELRMFLLRNVYVPLLLRAVNVMILSGTLAIGVRLRDELRRAGADVAVGVSPLTAIVFTPPSIAHALFQIWLEYFSRPIGLWGLAPKLWYTALELIFVCLWSAELSLALDNYFTSTVVCIHVSSPFYAAASKFQSTLQHGARKNTICSLQVAQICMCFISVVVYLVVFMVRLLRLVD
ncbi:bacterial leucyl aminopeptidase [Malassezia sp. CBS 17886]|nr:bacterial leucyl aminopeptidase [Malassezia sp. CBS 17886]